MKFHIYAEDLRKERNGGFGGKDIFEIASSRGPLAASGQKGFSILSMEK
jgi:hypothetical protein